MKTNFVPWKLKYEYRHEISEISGKLMLWILEGRSTVYMAEQLHLDLWQVEHNIDEMLYILRKQVGRKRFLRTLFWK